MTTGEGVILARVVPLNNDSTVTLATIVNNEDYTDYISEYETDDDITVILFNEDYEVGEFEREEGETM